MIELLTQASRNFSLSSSFSFILAFHQSSFCFLWPSISRWTSLLCLSNSLSNVRVPFTVTALRVPFTVAYGIVTKELHMPLGFQGRLKVGFIPYKFRILIFLDLISNIKKPTNFSTSFFLSSLVK